MTTAILASFLLAAASQGPEDAGATKERAAATQRERLLKLHLDDAAEYRIARADGGKEAAELLREPVYTWTNPIRASQQDGAVFVWTCRGRAEAVGCIFSAPSPGMRSVNHEFHSLSLGPLAVTRVGTHAEAWAPEAPGLALATVEGAPAPAETAAKRLAQMRAISRDFTASSRDAQDKRWELRLLPKPIYRYQSTDPDVVDGALFAFVTSAGTDPEVLMAVEARRPSGGGGPVWQYGLARFSDLDLSVKHSGTEVFTAPLIRGNMLQLYPKQQYRIFRDRGIPVAKGEIP